MIKDNTLLIIPNHLKQSILLKFSNVLQNIKVITINEFLKEYLFNYDKKAIYYLMNKYSIKYDVASIYLKNIYYVENKKYDSDKLNKLVEIKNELDNEELLIYNPLFKNKIKNMNIVFYNFEYIDKFYLKIIDEIKEITSVEIISDNENNNYQHNIYELKDINSELEFVASKICELIKDGVDINNIVLLNVADEYLVPLRRIFNIFNIPVNIPSSDNIMGTKIGNYFIDNLDSNINITIEKMNQEFNLNDENILDIYNKIISICNNYNWIKDFTSVKELLIHDLNNTKLKKELLTNAINIKSIDEYKASDSDYVFLLGFNQGSVPVLEKDEDYINDNLKNVLNLETTSEKNVIHRKKILTKIKNTKKLWITYKKEGQSGSLELSTLNDELNYPVIHNNKISYNYSHLNNLLVLSKQLDSYIKYSEKDSDLELLNSNYKDISYRAYDNKFSGINQVYENLSLSYSSMDNYYKCAFRYYVNSVLKLNIYEENFMNYIGSLFHFCLSKKEVLDLDESWTEFITEHKREFTHKEQFFLDKLKEELKFIFETIENQKEYTTFNQEEYEKYIEINKGDSKFVGIIDKILMNGDNAAIIDYKTGNPSLDLTNINYGLGLQLPIYLYLLKKANPAINIIGFYLQKILPSLITNDHTKTLASQKRNLLKLQGYSISDEALLNKFDKTYIDSELIKGMKVGNNGFYHYSKTLTKTHMDKITNIIDEKINEAITNIKDNNFTINPKKIGNENVGCAFCKFKDICYMNEKDIVRLKEIDNLDFLGGE